MTDVSYKRKRKGKFETQRHRRESLVNIEAETGVMLLQAKECVGSPEAGKGKE